MTTTPHLLTLDTFALLEIHGPDSLKFLQGQLTCDTQQLDATRLHHGAHCTPKGRMIANFDGLAIDSDRVLLRLRKDALPALQASLAKYIVFSKAELKNHGDSSITAIIGEEAGGWLQQQAGITLSEEQPVTIFQQNAFVRRDSQRIEIWPLAPNTELPDAIESLPCATDSKAWQLKDIEQGRGWIGAATSDSLLPQQLHLQTDAINGISFTKGCYTGQEIVARMHYKGSVKRAMHRFAYSGSLNIAEGDELRGEGSSQALGVVVNQVATGTGGECLLITTEQNGATELNCQVGNSPQKLTPLGLPYAITTES